MSESLGTVSLEVLVVHGPDWTSDERGAFGDGIRKVLAAAEARLRDEHSPVRLTPRILASDYQQYSDGYPAVAIVDVSTSDEGLAYLIGRISGRQVPCVFICRRADLGSVERLGLNVGRVHPYGSVREDLAGHAALQQEIRDKVSTSHILTALVHTVWFPPATNSIRVVCPQVLQPSEFAVRSNPDYTYLDNLGDTDALLDLMVFLSRRYPNAVISQHSANDLPRDHASGDLVVIGGPGDLDEISNQMCQTLMGEIGSCVSYSEDCQRMIVRGTSGSETAFEAQMARATGGPANPSTFAVRRDRGYFARFPNPLNEDTAVVLVNGIHTPGVLGAGRAFGDRREALKNYYAVLASGTDPRRFECHFDVRVINGDPQVPEIPVGDIFPLGTTAVKAGGLPAAAESTASSMSVTVMFVAGDRVGSRLSSVQIPKESEGIQEALRACKFREAFTFPVPIQAANTQKVAAAHRHNPTVMHFAGHGDERSLSFVADDNILVDAIPVSGEQLGNILQAFPRRVRLCVLNTCASSVIAEHLVSSGAADFAIGWPDRVSDSTAIAFSNSFYAHLGEGLGIARAVELASASGDGSTSPRLFVADGAEGNMPLVQGAEHP